MTLIAVLPGDGIGPEVMAPAFACSRRSPAVDVEEHVFGGASIDAHGIALTDETLAACRARRRRPAGRRRRPEVGHHRPARPRPEQGLLGLRKGLGLFANLRPVRAVPALYDASPLRARADRGHRPAGRARADRRHLLRREDAHRDSASDLCVYTVDEIERIARVAFGAARREASPASTRPTCSRPSRLWREVVHARAREEFPNVALEHVLVDNAAMQLVTRPAHFDVIVTENMFGDILSDEAAMITGSIGMLPERLARRRRPRACSSPSTAPRPTSPAGASPTRWRCSSRSALMLRHGLGLRSEAAAVESAVDRALADGPADARPRRRREHRRGDRGRARSTSSEGKQPT